MMSSKKCLTRSSDGFSLHDEYEKEFSCIDLALLPFGLCVLFLLLLGKLFGLTYKHISVKKCEPCESYSRTRLIC